MDASWLALFPSAPDESRLTRSVTAVLRSCTNTSQNPFRSPATRLAAPLSNATRWPSKQADGNRLSAFPNAPLERTLTHSVIPVARSWTNTSFQPLVSPLTRLDASLWKATLIASAERDG